MAVKRDKTVGDMEQMEDITEGQKTQVREAGTLGTEVGKRIRAARLDRGMTLAQVGGDDLSRSFLSLVELGRSRISLRALGIVAERLDLPISHFLDDSTSTVHASAELMLDYAEASLARQDPTEALRVLESVPESKSLQARALLLRGGALIHVGRAREAIAVLREGVQVAEKREDVQVLLGLRYRLGLALYTCDSYDEALVQLRRVVDDARDENEDPMLVGKAMVCIGHIYYVRNEIDAALQHYERARELFGEISDLNNLACVYSGMSVAYERKGDVQNALRYSKLSLGVFEAQNNGRQAATELNNMAVRYREVGDHDHALHYARDAVVRAQQVGAPDVEAAARSTLASVHIDLQNYEAARTQAEAAERVAQDNTLPQIHAWIVLAKIAEHDREHERADAMFQQALEQLDVLGHRASYSDAALSYSLALRERGDTERALEFALRAAQARPAQPV